MNSLVSSCLCSTCYAQAPFARYWRAIKTAANGLTRIKLPRLNLVVVQTPKSITFMYKNKIRRKLIHRLHSILPPWFSHLVNFNGNLFYMIQKCVEGLYYQRVEGYKITQVSSEED